MEKVEYSVYFVPVPIGNRADITLRALDVLRKVDVIACEDTRHSGLLLSHYEIRKPLISMHDHNEQPRAGEIAARAGGESFAVISDAGMPGVSDPGYRLIQTLKEKGVSFTVLPGPSAVVTALVGSGLPTDAFFFGGFLPVKSGKKKRCAPNGSGSFPYQYFFYESPHRIVKTVQALAALDPDIPVCVARELTKTFETYHRGPASRLAAEFAERPPKGEIVLLVGGVNAPRATR